MKKTLWITIGIIVGVIALLVIGGVIGANLFPKKIVTTTDSGKYCYDKDMTLYSANSVTKLPSDWEYYVVGLDVLPLSSQLCLNVNPGKSYCVFNDVCPNCAINKISCVCRN